jgi:single-strand DNA-binding protein
MSDLNSYSFTGRLGADAEGRYTPNGTAVWSARVAVGYGYGDNKGTNWLTVKVFGKRAEGLSKLDLRKGARIGGSGELQTREYDRKDGGKGFATEVVSQEIHLLDGKPEGEGQRGGGPVPQRGEQPKRGTARNEEAPAIADDDDIPFATNRGTW